MKKLFLFISGVLGIFLVLVFPQKSLAQSSSDYITSFNSDVIFNQDASISVKETINYHLSSSEHGIYREIPINYKTGEAFTRPTKLVLNDLYYFNNDYPSQKYTQYEVSTENGYTIFKIGDPDTEITGDYTYVIDYKLVYAINYFNDHDELYLNITGDEWDVPIGQVIANISVPGVITNKVCYTGTSGSTESQCIFDQITNNQVSVTTSDLSSYSGLTVALSMPKGSVADTTNQQRIAFVFANVGILLPLFVLPVMVIIIKRGNKNKKLTIVPTFDIPKNFDPLRVGFIYKGSISNNILTAQIIHLAINGYIKIKQTSKRSYQIIKTEKESPKDEELLLYNAIFKTKDSVNIKDLSNSFYLSVANTKNSVEKWLYTNDYLSQKQKNIFNTLLVISIAGLSINMVLLQFFISNAAMGWFLGILISFVIILFSALKIDKKTPKGNEIYYELEGLKMYINTAEKKRIEFHNDPQKYNGIFEKLLPYAVIFGLEKKWAKEFEEIYTVAPDWYDGNWNTFNTYIFVNSIGNFNRQINNYSMSNNRGFASSHAGFGGSGFSGGSSGGGFGGGGGGSW